MPAYYGQVNTSCALDRCLQAVHDNIGLLMGVLAGALGNYVGIGVAYAIRAFIGA